MRETFLLAILLIVDVSAFFLLFLGDVLGQVIIPRDLAVFAMLGSTFLTISTAMSIRMQYWRDMAVLLVQNGAIRAGSARDSVVSSKRQVPVAVESGHVLILEKFGEVSRILGPGSGYVLPGETVSRVVQIRPRVFTDLLECATRDGIPIRIDFWVSARVSVEGARSRVSSMLRRASTEWSKSEVVKAAYYAHDWGGATVSTARVLLREGIAEMVLDEIYDPARLALTREKTQKELSRRSYDWGTDIIDLQIARITVPPEVDRKWIEVWQGKHG